MVSFAYSAGTNAGGAQVFIAGQTNTVTGTPGIWQTASITFTATQDSTVLEIDAIAGQPGLLLDSFTLAGGMPYYVLPEETLDKLKTERAKGRWQLEVWDNRAGPTLASNSPAPTLVSWQLSFI